MIWNLKRKLSPRNNTPLSVAKKDEAGNLVTDAEELEDLYIRTYSSRLSPNQVPAPLEDIKDLKAYLFDLNFALAQCDKTSDWSLTELDIALNSMKNNKARDLHGFTSNYSNMGAKI